MLQAEQGSPWAAGTGEGREGEWGTLRGHGHAAPPRGGSRRGADSRHLVVRASPLRREEKAMAAARSISPAHLLVPWIAGEHSLAHHGARQPVSLIPCVPLPQGGGQAGLGVAGRAAGRSSARAREKAGKRPADVHVQEGLELTMPVW